MSLSFAVTMHQTARMMHHGAQLLALQEAQRSVVATMVSAAFAPMAAFQPKEATRRAADVSDSGRSLGAVLTQLSTAQGLMPGAGSSRQLAAPRIGQGAHYLTRRHRSAAGSRGYKLYLPGSPSNGPEGLIVMLHGCNQTPDDFAIGTNMNALAETHGLAIAYPAQAPRHNAARCWNWFKPGNQARGAGEPAILASLTRKLMREFGLGRDTTFVAGLSSGGAMAVILADVYPDLFSAAGVHSGLARGAACNVLSAMAAMRRGGDADEGEAPDDAPMDPPSPVPGPAPATVRWPVRRIVFQGDRDSTVHPSNAALIVAAALGADAIPARVSTNSVRGRGYERSRFGAPDDVDLLELWMLAGGEHAWSGGRAAGSYTDGTGPDASAQMIRFFLANSG